jgi:hypothetical protein
MKYFPEKKLSQSSSEAVCRESLKMSLILVTAIKLNTLPS